MTLLKKIFEQMNYLVTTYSTVLNTIVDNFVE